jgi:hypothetical protein
LLRAEGVQRSGRMKGFLKRARLLIALVVAGLLLGGARNATAGFSDGELRAIHSQMLARRVVRCGMTAEQLIDRYKQCGQGSLVCADSLIVVSASGACNDALLFENLRAPDARIMLNGETFERPTIPSIERGTR